MAKSEKQLPTNTPSELKSEAPSEPSEMVIKEIMVQKGITREEAIQILKNPA